MCTVRALPHVLLAIQCHGLALGSRNTCMVTLWRSHYERHLLPSLHSLWYSLKSEGYTNKETLRIGVAVNGHNMSELNRVVRVSRQARTRELGGGREGAVVAVFEVVQRIQQG
ncbi:hypothetical protein E2C01_065611 [Portunus trituberculatus]|uniref:Secreted protein n=1 Tax=Portunus trituberculatus TaxID=210409 RepID=A0A5B7HNV4_PORTR|nr:hypothetical protein [Portunus trituberculatus]